MNRIEQLRKENNLNQRQLAAELGVHQTAVSQWETERTDPDFDKLMHLCEIFNVRPEYLMGRSSEKGHFNLTDAEIDELAEGEAASSSLADLFERLKSEYAKLNLPGQEKAIEQVELLTEIPKYQRKEDSKSNEPGEK